MKKRHANRGFSLVELMVAGAMGGMLLLGAGYVFTQVNSKKRVIEKTSQTETDRRLMRFGIEAELRKGLPLRVWVSELFYSKFLRLNPSTFNYAWSSPPVDANTTVPDVAPTAGLRKSGLVLPRHCIEVTSTSPPAGKITPDCGGSGRFDLAILLSKAEGIPALKISDNPTISASSDLDPAFYFLDSSMDIYVEGDPNPYNGSYVGVATPQGVMIARVSNVSGGNRITLDFSGLGTFTVPEKPTPVTYPISVLTSGGSVFKVAIFVMGATKDAHDFVMGYKMLEETDSFRLNPFKITLNGLSIGDLDTASHDQFYFRSSPPRYYENTFQPKERALRMRMKMTREKLTSDPGNPTRNPNNTVATELVLAI